MTKFKRNQEIWCCDPHLTGNANTARLVRYVRMPHRIERPALVTVRLSDGKEFTTHIDFLFPEDEHEPCGACDGRGVDFGETCVTCGGSGDAPTDDK